MSLEDDKALVRRSCMEIDKGNLAAMDELVSENYTNHDPAPFPGSPSGRAGLKHAFEQFCELHLVRQRSLMRPSRMEHPTGRNRGASAGAPL